jgi:hypothetical protein
MDRVIKFIYSFIYLFIYFEAINLYLPQSLTGLTRINYVQHNVSGSVQTVQTSN